MIMQRGKVFIGEATRNTQSCNTPGRAEFSLNIIVFTGGDNNRMISQEVFQNGGVVMDSSLSSAGYIREPLLISIDLIYL